MSLVDAALAIAHEHGLPIDRPRVVRDLTNVLVHVEPAPVVVRVQLTLAGLRGREWADAEMRAAQFLAREGAPIRPREYDIACIRFRPLPETEEAIAGYGGHDEDAVDRALVYVTLFLAAVTHLVAARGGEEARAEAKRRVERALRYAREM